MSTEANYFKIGIFVVVGVVLAVVGTIVLGAGTFFQKGVRVETYFDGSVQGLSVGSPVKFRGVKIGEVDEIIIATREYDTNIKYVVVRAYLPSEGPLFRAEDGLEGALQAEIDRGLRVRMAAVGVTGTAYLEVDYLDPQYNPVLRADWRAKYPYLPSAPSVFTQVGDFLTRIMRSMDEIDLEGALKGMESTLNNINDTLAQSDLVGIGREAQSLLGELRATNLVVMEMAQILRDEQIAENLGDTLASMRGIAKTAEEQLPPAVQSLENAGRQLDRLPEVLAAVKATLNRLDRLVGAQHQDLAATVENIRRISENIEELTAETRKYPAGVLFGAPPGRRAPGEE
jgi:ABC-type transporter Mla subunit MlaD